MAVGIGNGPRGMWRCIAEDGTELDSFDGVLCVDRVRHASIDKRPNVDRDAIAEAVSKEANLQAGMSGHTRRCTPDSDNRLDCLCTVGIYVYGFYTRMIRCHNKEELTIRVD